jgi:hypothetical protein
MYMSINMYSFHHWLVALLLNMIIPIQIIKIDEGSILWNVIHLE